MTAQPPPDRANILVKRGFRGRRLLPPAVRTPVPPPVTVLLPEPLRSDVIALRDADDEVGAVRLVREQTGIGLLPAVMAVRAATD